MQSSIKLISTRFRDFDFPKSKKIVGLGKSDSQGCSGFRFADFEKRRSAPKVSGARHPDKIIFFFFLLLPFGEVGRGFTPTQSKSKQSNFLDFPDSNNAVNCCQMPGHLLPASKHILYQKYSEHRLSIPILTV